MFKKLIVAFCLLPTLAYCSTVSNYQNSQHYKETLGTLVTIYNMLGPPLQKMYSQAHYEALSGSHSIEDYDGIMNTYNYIADKYILAGKLLETLRSGPYNHQTLEAAIVYLHTVVEMLVGLGMESLEPYLHTMERLRALTED